MPVQIRLRVGKFADSKWEAIVITSDDDYIPVGAAIRNDTTMIGGVGNGMLGSVLQLTVNGSQPFGIDILTGSDSEMIFERRQPRMHH